MEGEGVWGGAESGLWKRDTQGQSATCSHFHIGKPQCSVTGASPAWDSRGAFGLEERLLLSGFMLLVSALVALSVKWGYPHFPGGPRIIWQFWGALEVFC